MLVVAGMGRIAGERASSQASVTCGMVAPCRAAMESRTRRIVCGPLVSVAAIGGATVLTNSKGFTLYSFAPDTSTKSNCNGTCAQNWPPVKGPATASGVKGTFGTIKRSDGSAQATFDGHPLYTFVGDTAPGQAKGNGLNVAGGLWHEITTSGTAPAGSSTSGSGGGGSGY
jgi:predicted lipoprotein with Yx(FWY)xxD motif